MLKQNKEEVLFNDGKTNYRSLNRNKKNHHSFISDKMNDDDVANKGTIIGNDDPPDLKEENDLVDCQCCFESYTKDDLFECSASLGHKVCQTCIKNYVSEQVDGKNSGEYPCFAVEDCKCQYSEMVLTTALPEALKKRADIASYRKSVGAMDDVWTCGVCNGSYFVDRNYCTQFCQGCNGIEYCTFCFRVAHPSKYCDEVKKEADRLKDPRQVAEEAMAAVVIRRCPTCKAKFVKDVGCNRMTCVTPGCGTMSCYLCKKQVAGYDHFCGHAQPCQNRNCKKECLLWTSEAVMEEIEKEWKLKAGRKALKEHGLKDPKKVEETLASISAA